MKAIIATLATATLLWSTACSDKPAPAKSTTPAQPAEQSSAATPAPDTETPAPDRPQPPAPKAPEAPVIDTGTAAVLIDESADDAAASTVPAEGESQLLSLHDTLATFRELKPYRCMGRTALCPDECGHSGSLAIFDIIRYNDYQKPGEYGDPKTETFQILVMDNHGNAKIDKDILKTINDLNEGDTVTLKWRHDYVTRDNASFPVRTITELTPQP